MLYALNNQKEKISPSRGESAICPCCEGKVISKCGEIIAWHWAHARGSDCDDWYESDNKWSIDWKNRFNKDNCEIIIDGRRADIKTDNDEIIRLQKRTLSPEEIRDIEEHFGNMVWVFKLDDAVHNIEFRDKGRFTTFRWKYPKKTIAYTSKPTILDLGDNKLFILKKMYKGTPCGGWGYFFDVEQFLKTNKFNTYKFSKVEDEKKNWKNRNTEDE